jgi:hypothetical protein
MPVPEAEPEVESIPLFEDDIFRGARGVTLSESGSRRFKRLSP